MSQIDNRRKSDRRDYRSQGSRSGTGRRSQTARRKSSYQPRGTANRRKKGPSYDITKILLGIIIIIVAVIVITAVVKMTGSDRSQSTEAASTEETQLEKEVTVDGISITGMSREEAKEALLEEFQWGMKVTYNGEEYPVDNLMAGKIDDLLEEIYTGEPKESYTLDTSGLEDAAAEAAAAAAAQWDVEPQNGEIESFNEETGSFVYTAEKNGIKIDQEKLASDILTQVNAREFQAVIEASANEVAPDMTAAEAKEKYQVIGTYTTTTTANSDRNKNIELASDAINGVVVQPGQEFSFNNTTGERSEAKGYRPAGAYVNGVLVEEPGGGVCQVSSTLYNAVVFSGLTTTERHAHSYEPSYVTPGEDAMVSFGGPDMKFVNNSPYAVAIRANFANRQLRISIVGIPILEEGVTISMHSEKVAELDAPAPVYEEDQTLQPGEEKIVKAETKGSRWVTNLVTKKNGEVISDEFFHNSTYRGKSATIRRNTSGVVIQPTDPSASSGDSSAASGGETSAASTETTSQTPAESSAAPTTSAAGPGVAETTTAASTTEAAGPGVTEASTTAAEPGTIAPNPMTGN